MTVSFHSSPLAVLLLGAVLVVSPAAAQERHRVTQTPGELIAAFVREYQTPGGVRSGASLDLTHVLTYHTDYSPADVEALLRDLEQLALTGEPSRLRASAASRLALPGSRRSIRPILGILARLERIYSRSGDPWVRSLVVSAMANLAERQAALVFLERIAVQAPDEQDYPGASFHALGIVAAMDDEGRAVLRRLHETRAVREPEARDALSVMASHEYRLN